MRDLNRTLLPPSRMRRGTWRHSHIFQAYICCPRCGAVAYLGQDHTVSPEGYVSPSVRCPDAIACQFDEFVILKGWRMQVVPMPSDLRAVA